MINPFEKYFTEKRNVTTCTYYIFAGFGIDAQSIYAEWQYKFSIAKGLIQEDTFTRYVEENGNTYNSFIRR